jgi:hypothetical protein
MQRVVSVGWVGAGLVVVYLAAAGWAASAYRKAEGWSLRVLFSSIITIAVLVFASRIISWWHPELPGVLHYPVGTVLGYLFAALVVVALALAARSKRNRPAAVDSSLRGFC